MTLRSRLLAAFLLLTLVPIAVISAVALVQLSRAIARWYRPGVDRTLVSALEVTKTTVTRLEGVLLVQAEELSARWPAAELSDAEREAARATLGSSGLDLLQTYRRTDGGWRLAVEIAPPGVLLADGPDLAADLQGPLDHPRIVRSLRGVLAATAPMRSGDALVVGIRLSPDTFAQIDSVGNGVTYYRRLGVTAELQRRAVLLLVAGMTVLLVVASVLLSARFARQTSQPLSDLSHALGRVAGGELSARVEPGGAAEMRSLGESFNTMTHRLDEARQALLEAEREAAWRDVARKLAHEFKNTLTPMRLSLQLLEAHLDEAPAEQRGPMRRSLQAALREVDSLTRLAGQFSQYARLPEPSFESVDLHELARNAGALLQDGTVEVRVVGSGSTTVLADPELVSRALGNLLLNAREASSPAAAVEIHVVPHDTDVELQVLDRGSGLPADLRDRLFEPYVSTKKRGSGLGLSLIRDIARQHRGSVTLENRSEGGACASLRLPRDPARPSSTVERPPNPEGIERGA